MGNKGSSRSQREFDQFMDELRISGRFEDEAFGEYKLAKVKGKLDRELLIKTKLFFGDENSSKLEKFIEKRQQIKSNSLCKIVQSFLIEQNDFCSNNSKYTLAWEFWSNSLEKEIKEKQAVIHKTEELFDEYVTIFSSQLSLTPQDSQHFFAPYSLFVSLLFISSLLLQALFLNLNRFGLKTT
jgi:hypothetical protein